MDLRRCAVALAMVLALVPPAALAVTKSKAVPSGHVAPAKTIKVATKQPLFLWKISKGDKYAYLLGSIHLVPANFYPLPKEVEKTFAQSDGLVLEIDESKSNPATVQMLTMTKGLYAPGDGLEKHLSSDTLKELVSYIDSTGQSLAPYARMKPWLASITIPILELKKRGFDPSVGIDKHFLNEAKQSNKPVEEVESADFQIQLLSGFDDDLQDHLLRSALRDVERTDDDAKQMTEAWKTGNADQMNSIITRDEKDHPELKPIMEKLMYERNVAMAARIEQFIASGKKDFVVVGAGHVVGERGILKLLKDRGYTVEQMKTE